MSIYNREALLAICEASCVEQHKWRDRDSAEAQMQVGKCYALLKAHCDFKVMEGEPKAGQCVTDERTIWVEVEYEGFMYHEDPECGRQKDTFYLPTPARLDETKGEDWY